MDDDALDKLREMIEKSPYAVLWTPSGDLTEAKVVTAWIGPGWKHPLDDMPEPGPTVHFNDDSYVALYGARPEDFFLAVPVFKKQEPTA